MNAPLPAFQQFQMDFGRRCRDPRAPRPAGVPARNMAIYEELLFNNISDFLDACFPVCRQMIGETRWRRLNRAFFRDWRGATPLFRHIPREFTQFLETVKYPLPAWLCDLAHYEWAELAVDTCDAVVAAHHADGDLMSGRLLLNPTLMNLAYAWPVHRIGAGRRPRPMPTHLLVFRDASDSVRFAEINEVTARLIDLIANHDASGAAAVERLARELPEETAAAVRIHGAAILDDLRRQGAILGVRI